MPAGGPCRPDWNLTDGLNNSDLGQCKLETRPGGPQDTAVPCMLKKTLKGGFAPPALSTRSQFELLSVLGGPGAQAKERARARARTRERGTSFPLIPNPAARHGAFELETVHSLDCPVLPVDAAIQYCSVGSCMPSRPGNVKRHSLAPQSCLPHQHLCESFWGHLPVTAWQTRASTVIHRPQ